VVSLGCVLHNEERYYLYKSHGTAGIVKSGRLYKMVWADVPSKLRAYAAAHGSRIPRTGQSPAHCFFILVNYKFLLFLGAYKFNVFYRPFPNIAAPPPPPRVAQANPIAAQKTPWFAHLHSRLRGNVGLSI
jgi:hypothetical protein